MVAFNAYRQGAIDFVDRKSRDVKMKMFTANAHWYKCEMFTLLFTPNIMYMTLLTL